MKQTFRSEITRSRVTDEEDIKGDIRVDTLFFVTTEVEIQGGTPFRWAPSKNPLRTTTRTTDTKGIPSLI